MNANVENGQALQQRLTSSLREIISADALGHAELSRAFEQLITKLSGDKVVEPSAYHNYFLMLRNMQAGERRAYLAAARRLADAQILPRSQLEIIPLNSDNFGPSKARALRDQFSSESLHSWQIRSIPAKKLSDVLAQIDRAIDMLKRYAPRSFAQFDAITTEVIPAFGAARDGMTYNGCSSVERWGAILINMRPNYSDMLVAETLVHESAHSLLFSMQPSERLLLNGPDERYESPLRVDPRPLDGILHASFVLSHMHGFCAEIAAHPDTPAELRKEAKETLKTRFENFTDGYSVLEKHARYTPTGREIMAAAKERVAAVA